jgi:hypothetical protein
MGEVDGTGLQFVLEEQTTDSFTKTKEKVPWPLSESWKVDEVLSALQLSHVSLPSIEIVPSTAMHPTPVPDDPQGFVDWARAPDA